MGGHGHVPHVWAPLLGAPALPSSRTLHFTCQPTEQPTVPNRQKRYKSKYVDYKHEKLATDKNPTDLAALSKKERGRVEDGWKDYYKGTALYGRLGKGDGKPYFELLDVARRLEAGTGSLGTSRWGRGGMYYYSYYNYYVYNAGTGSLGTSRCVGGFGFGGGCGRSGLVLRTRYGLTTRHPCYSLSVQCDTSATSGWGPVKHICIMTGTH